MWKEGSWPQKAWTTFQRTLDRWHFLWILVLRLSKHHSFSWLDNWALAADWGETNDLCVCRLAVEDHLVFYLVNGAELKHSNRWGS